MTNDEITRKVNDFVANIIPEMVKNSHVNNIEDAQYCASAGLSIGVFKTALSLISLTAEKAFSVNMAVASTLIETVISTLLRSGIPEEGIRTILEQTFKMEDIISNAKERNENKAEVC